MTAADSTGFAPHAAASSQLGKSTTYTGRYDPSLLFAIERAPQRAAIGLADPLPFFGADLWTGYELSWLGPRGRPQVAIAYFTIPCESPCIVESKSFKLYLNSLGETVFPSAEAVRDRIRADLSQVISRGAATPISAGVRLVGPDDFEREKVSELEGLSLDRMDVDCAEYSPAPHFLQSARDEQPVTEVLTSNLLKTNCPVTGQPDWGSVQIGYSGPQIEQGGLLRYLVSFRQHQDFHEHCVERMFHDIWIRCAPTRLWVFARYTRRGGLDINPFRTSHPRALPPLHRTARQ